MKIYMDYAATTPVDSRVAKAMVPYFSQRYGNPSSLHSWGQEAKSAIEDAREKISSLIAANPEEVVFTSGGTESDNLAIRGVALANKNKGRHIITSSIEHHAVLNTCKALEKEGFEITYLPVDKYGFVSLMDLEKAIRKDTILVSIMHANNEIGTIEPIAEIGKLCREKGVYFHTDAVQTFGKVPIDVEKMNIDLLSASSHKIYGPKGVGALYIREGVKISSLIHGGGHEKGLRSGTENVAGIVGFGAATGLAKKQTRGEAVRLTKLRNKLISGVLKIENSFLNGHPKKRLPGNANFWFKFIEGEALVLLLDEKGIAASTGSACSTKELKPSHVLTAIGLKPEEAHGSLRLTLGRQSTAYDVYYVLSMLSGCVARLREISPFKKRWT